MTKIFDIIHLNGFLYMVDKEDSNKREGNQFLCLDQPDYPQFHKDYGMADDCCWIVLASNDPSLSELPKLPPIEEDVDSISEKILGKGLTGTIYESYWLAGYKAASKKKYTEEDIHKLFINMLDSLVKEPTVRYTWKTAKEFLKSLNPLPKQVEVEMDSKILQFQPAKIEYFPKLTDGFVTVKQWIYEESKES